jgi:ATP-dependent DNA helicase RecQ
LDQTSWVADPSQVVLSWPGYFAPGKPIHSAIAALDIGSELVLRVRNDGKPGWEITDINGIVVARMARAFSPPCGEILSVRVSAILVRVKRQAGENVICERWEVVLPEIVFSASS